YRARRAGAASGPIGAGMSAASRKRAPTLPPGREAVAPHRSSCRPRQCRLDIVLVEREPFHRRCGGLQLGHSLFQVVKLVLRSPALRDEAADDFAMVTRAQIGALDRDGLRLDARTLAQNGISASASAARRRCASVTRGRWFAICSD